MLLGHRRWGVWLSGVVGQDHPSPWRGGGGETASAMGYTSLLQEGSGHKLEDAREELPRVRLSCQTTLGGPIGVNSP